MWTPALGRIWRRKNKMYIIVLIAIFLLFYAIRHIFQSKTKLCKENLANIEYFISLNRNYSIFISEHISDKRNSDWKKIVDKSDRFFITDKGKVKKTNIKKYCVLYPSGEILNISHNLLNIPEGAYWVEDNDILDFKELSESEVALNSNDVLINMKKSKYPQSGYFITEIKNNLNIKIFPIAFGGYIKRDEKYILDNVINTVYSDIQFKNWYNCKNEYLSPGEIVSDPNNYGDNDCYWIYIFKTESGDIIKVGKYI